MKNNFIIFVGPTTVFELISDLNFEDWNTLVPIFSLFKKNKIHFKDLNTFELSCPSRDYDLTSNIAPIFATFGYKDPRYYLSLS